MKQSLEQHVGRVILLGPFPNDWRVIGKSLNRISKMVFRRSFDYDHTITRSRRMAGYFESRLSEAACDIIFAPAGSNEIAFLETDIPILYSSDATFSLLEDYYPYYSRLWPFSARTVREIERRSLERSRIAVYPTTWAARSAREEYRLPRENVVVIPYGANAEPTSVSDALKQKHVGPVCRLAFLAVEWWRKGGDIAFETLKELHYLGVAAELTVIGCVPPREFRDEHLRVIPFLDKNRQEDRDRLEQILSGSHFLLVPTRAEAYGIVFCEASAFGLPSIATDTGGVSGVVREGKNGHLLPFNARGKDYARVIESIWRVPSNYRNLVKSARKEFEVRLNWDRWGREMGQLINCMLGNAGRSVKGRHFHGSRVNIA